MDKEVASCPSTEADQSPNDDMPDGRTNEEVGEQRKANIRKRMALEKEEKEAKMEVRMKERNIAHGTRDEPYFARNYLSSEFVAGKTCTCGHVFGQTAGNYQAWMHYRRSSRRQDRRWTSQASSR